MRKEYDLKKQKVKRRGVIPALKAKDGHHAKVRITISLDKEVIDYFKSEAKHPGAFPYQTQINQALRKLIKKWQTSGGEDFNSLKEDFLHDSEFIRRIADEITQRQTRK